MTDIAQAAGVSRETLHKAFGTKPRLLKAVYDVVVVGDEESVPVLQREEWRSMTADPDPRSLLRTFGRLSAELVARAAPILRVLAEAGGDIELTELIETTRAERLAGARALVEALREKATLRSELDVDQATDVVWALCSPEMALLLTQARGWSLEAYAAWLADTIASTIIRPRPPRPPSAADRRAGR